MGVLLVTVAGPGGRAADLALPAHVPVTALAGAVAEAVLGPGAAGDWSLAWPGGDRLPPEGSLAACGVGDGAVLALSAGPAGGLPAPTAAVPDPPRPTVPAPPGPGRAAGGTAPVALAGPPLSWPVGARAAAAVRALARGGRAGALEPIRRAGRAWRGTAYERVLEAAVAAPVQRRCACIGVVSAAPGAGGTTVALLLAAVLATRAPDGRAPDGRLPAVAVDAHPGPGSLTEVLAEGPDLFADDLVDVLEHPALTRPELRSVLGRAGRGLAVLAARAGDAEGAEPPAGPVAPTGPVPAAARTAGRLDERGWARVVRALAEHAASVVVDCGPGLAAPGTRAAVAAADQLVLVVDARLPRAAPTAAGPLAALGRPAAVVANQAPAGLRAGEVLERVPRARGAVLLPAGAAGLGALPFGWESVPRAAWGQASRSAWRQAYELAALLVSDWPSLGLADGPAPGLADARLEDAADPPARPRQPARSGRRLPRSPEPNRGTANAQARRLE